MNHLEWLREGDDFEAARATVSESNNMSTQPAKCLVPDCERHGTIRGLCQLHYNYASTLISRKKTTWDKLVKTGKALESRKVNRTISNTASWFLNK